MSDLKDKSEKPEAFAQMLEVPEAELYALADAAESRALKPEEGRTFRALVSTFTFMRKQWQSREISNGKLLKMVLGEQSEKTRVVLGDPPEADEAEDVQTA